MRRTSSRLIWVRACPKSSMGITVGGELLLLSSLDLKRRLSFSFSFYHMSFAIICTWYGLQDVYRLGTITAIQLAEYNTYETDAQFPFFCCRHASHPIRPGTPTVYSDQITFCRLLIVCLVEHGRKQPEKKRGTLSTLKKHDTASMTLHCWRVTYASHNRLRSEEDGCYYCIEVS